MYSTIAVLIISTSSGLTHLPLKDTAECIRVQQTLHGAMQPDTRMNCIEVIKGKKAVKKEAK
jgi:hypothetical protein